MVDGLPNVAYKQDGHVVDGCLGKVLGQTGVVGSNQGTTMSNSYQTLRTTTRRNHVLVPDHECPECGAQVRGRQACQACRDISWREDQCFDMLWETKHDITRPCSGCLQPFPCYAKTRMASIEWADREREEEEKAITDSWIEAMSGLPAMKVRVNSALESALFDARRRQRRQAKAKA